MSGVNKAILIGRLGRDPEIRYAPSGTAVVNFTMATSEKWGQDREERTEWHRIVAFGRLAEICNQYLVKGKQIYIEGRIQTRDWEDKDGNKRSTTEIVANNMQMLDSASSGYGGRDSAGPRDSKDSNRYGRDSGPPRDQDFGGRNYDQDRGRQGGEADKARKPDSFGRGQDYDQGSRGSGGFDGPPGDDEIPF